MGEVYVLKNWTLSQYKDVLYALGDVYDNPNFGQGFYVKTGIFKTLEMNCEKQRFDVVTQSDEHYVLPFNCVSTYGQASKEILISNKLKTFDRNLIESVFEGWVESSEKRLTEEEIASAKHAASFVNIIPENSLYLELFGSYVELAVFHRKHSIESEAPLCYEIKRQNHIGMVQDSVLILDWKYGLADYRYFPSGNKLKTYQWSDGIERIIVKNVGNTRVHLDETVIELKDTVVINKKDT